MSSVLIAAIVLGVVLLWAVVSFNRFVSQRNLIANSWSNVETELRRRYDLIPNLVETVGGYASHEKSTLTEVIEARAGAVASTGDVEAQAGAENVLVEGLRHLLAVSEDYPELVARSHFLELQRELVTTEDRIQASRRLFNGNVRDYNQRVEAIPSRLIAALGRYRKADYFEVEPAVAAARPPSATKTF
jgi:LemA protein